MGTTNYGNQEIQWQYYDPLNSDEFDKHNQDIIPIGIYKGGNLYVVNTSTIRVQPLVCMISDGTQAARVKTADPVDLAIVYTTPYVVLRWSWQALTNWYMDMLVVATPSANDIVVGKGVFNGSHELINVEYDTRTVPPILLSFLKVSALGTPALKIFVNGGWVSYGSSRLPVAAQEVDFSGLVPSAPNSQIYIVWVTSAGVISVTGGTPAPSPVAPVHSGKIVLAEVLLANTDTVITDGMITDCRPWINLGGSGGMTGIIPSFLLMGA